MQPKKTAVASVLTENISLNASQTSLKLSLSLRQRPTHSIVQDPSLGPFIFFNVFVPLNSPPPQKKKKIKRNYKVDGNSIPCLVIPLLFQVEILHERISSWRQICACTMSKRHLVIVGSTVTLCYLVKCVVSAVREHLFYPFLEPVCFCLVSGIILGLQSRTGDPVCRNWRNHLQVQSGSWMPLFLSGETDDDEDGEKVTAKEGGLSKGDRSHLIVWQVFTSNN